MNRPEDASDTTINELWEQAQRITQQHVENLRNDPTLAAHLDANPGEVLEYADNLAAQSRSRLRIQVDPSVLVATLAEALASKGLCLRHNAESNDLYLTFAPEYCRHGVEIKDDETYPAACESCVDDEGSAMTEEGLAG